MKTVTPIPGEGLMELGKRCDAVYICPKDGHVRRGPLVAYAGKGPDGKNYVGDIYFNFGRIEPHLRAVKAFADVVYLKLQNQELLDTFDTICGIPHGGRTFGQMLASVTGKRFVYADKKPKPTEAGKKQEYTWDLSRFDFEPGERVAVAEDVFNNFQNTRITLAEITATGAKIVLLVGALNRSPIYDTVYTSDPSEKEPVWLPIVAAIREAYPEYEQNDPAVAADVAAGNIELRVKDNWARLRAIMEQYS